MSLISEELRSSKEAMANVFSNHALRRIFLAFAGSLIGDGVFALSAAVYAYRTGGATAVGVLAVVRYVAIATVAPFTSTLAAQYSRKLVMVGSDLVRLVLVTTAAAMVAFDASKWVVYALVVAIGLAGTAFRIGGIV